MTILFKPFGFIAPEALCFFSFPIFRLWAYLMKVIQKCVVRIKFDIYVFITNCVAILALSKWRLHAFHIKWCHLTVTRWCNMWRRAVTIPEHLSSPPIRVALSLVFRVMFCWSLFVLLPFFFWPLYCLSFSIDGFWMLQAFLVCFTCTFDNILYLLKLFKRLSSLTLVCKI